MDDGNFLDIEVLILRCPNCGGELDAFPEDVVFFCGQCQRGYQINDAPHHGSAGFIPVDVSFASPQLPGEKMIFLPFWEFEATINISCKDKEKLVAAQNMITFNHIFVTGFLSNLSLDMGINFTKDSLKYNSAKGKKLVGCIRRKEEAEMLAKYNILAIIDRKVDVSGLDVELEFVSSKIVGIPFIDKGTTLICAIGRREVLPKEIEKIEDFRRIFEKEGFSRDL